MVSFPYYSHIFRDSYGSGMGIVWEAYHKGVPLLAVPGISLDSLNKTSPWGIFLVLMWFDRYYIYMQNDGWYTKSYPFDRSVLDTSNQVMHFPWQRCILKTQQCLEPWHHWKTANHPFSGAMLVSGRAIISLYTYMSWNYVILLSNLYLFPNLRKEIPSNPSKIRSHSGPRQAISIPRRPWIFCEVTRPTEITSPWSLLRWI